MLSLIYTGLFSLAVAILVWWLTELRDFSGIVLVSLSIGWSIHLAFMLTHERLQQWLGPWLAPAPPVALGLAAGLLSGGLFVAGQPLYFFSQDFRALGLGLFFGITGFLIFGARERLRKAARLLAESELKQSQQEKLLAESELALLQARIEPHFLFNTLSNITQLVRSNPDLAVSALEHLTTLLRRALAHSRASTGTLGQEIDFSRAWLAIQAARMPGRLHYRLDLPQELRDVPLPPLLVQPLLENAVIHGIETGPAGGEVAFSARRDGNTLILRVTDSGAGINECGSPGGTGLRNVRDRLRLRYGNAATLELTPASPRGVNAVINIPLTES